MLRARHRLFRNLFVASDTLIVAGAAIAAYHVRFRVLDVTMPPAADEVVRYGTHAIPILTAVPIMLVTMMACGLYRPHRDRRFHREAGTLVKAIAIGTLLTFAVISFFSRVLYDGRDPSRLQYVVYAALLLVSLGTWRFAFRSVMRHLRRRGWNLRHVAIVGTGRLGQVVHETLRRNSWTGITPSYFVSHHRASRRTECLGLPVHGALPDLESVLDAHPVTGVFLALPGRMTAELPDLLVRLERHAINVRIVPDMNPRFMPINMSVGELDSMPVLSVRESPLSGSGGVAKRALDLVGAAAGLVVFALPMLVIAALVRASGPGPVIFRQERMSLNGSRFLIFKFRTMQHVEAEALSLRDQGRGTDAWTKAGDPRITRIGRFLRRTSLDELPQLLNVLSGQMSLVGPRPERPELIQRFREDWRGYMLRQNVKAGMTGWAQVNGLRGDTSLRKRLQYDLFYVRNWSLLFDLRILWLTLFLGFRNPGAA